MTTFCPSVQPSSLIPRRNASRGQDVVEGGAPRSSQPIRRTLTPCCAGAAGAAAKEANERATTHVRRFIGESNRPQLAGSQLPSRARALSFPASRLLG